MLEPVRTGVSWSTRLRALAFGFAPFEVVWGTDGGPRRAVAAKLKPLLPEATTVLVDRRERERAGGAEPAGGPSAAGGPARGRRRSCYTYDGAFGDPYGRSRHENVRVAWSQAVQTAERLAQYQKKVAGVIAQLHYPEGTSRDASGVERGNDVVAQQILEAVSMGRSVRFPNLFASVDDPAAAADLAGKSQWVLSQFDTNGTDHSGGLLAALGYYDKLLFRGWLRPERAGLEAEHGSRADAQSHGETGVRDAELVDADVAAAFNAGVVDDLLVANFGPAAKGAVRVDPSPIAADKTDTAKAVLTALLGNAQTAAATAQAIDVRAVLADLDVPSS